MVFVVDRDMSVKKLQLGLICCSIAANALTAGGIFMFPLFSPALASRLRLTQPQLTTIVLAAMIGQYPFSSIVGKVIDRHGPAACSLVAAALFSTAFGMSSLEIATAPLENTHPSSSSFHRLAFFFLLAGLGTVFSYFSSLFAASKTFPRYPGIASGASMALFGLSPLCLSTIATTFFTEESGMLNITRFMNFMALLTGCIHIVSAIFLMAVPLSEPPSNIIGDEESEAEVDESTTLLASKVLDGSQSTHDDQSALELLQDQEFWLLGLFCLLILGASEMVISNLGTIILSLPPASSMSHIVSEHTAHNVTAKQIRILSLSNTLSRIVVGPMADFLSPVATHRFPTTILPRHHRISRIAFLSGPALLLVITFFWTEIGVRSQDAVWALSAGIGIAYGATFTVLPSVVAAVWGNVNLGRNFGIITYAPFIGTPLFSYMYAFIAAVHSHGESICTGLSCWQSTFWVSFGTSVVAFAISVMLWRRWKGRI